MEVTTAILGEMYGLPWLLRNSMRDMTWWKNKCEKGHPTHLIQLLSKRPTRTSRLYEPSSLHIVMIVKIALLLPHSNGKQTQLLVNATSEGLEIVHFVEKHSDNIRILNASKFSRYFWSSRDDPDHWSNKGFRTALKSINTKKLR